jgi:hypothetical protein
MMLRAGGVPMAPMFVQRDIRRWFAYHGCPRLTHRLPLPDLVMPVLVMQGPRARVRRGFCAWSNLFFVAPLTGCAQNRCATTPCL